MTTQKKIKLLFITYTHSNGGGAEAVLTTLVNNLDSEKYDISIFEIVNYNVKKEPLNPNINFFGSLFSPSDSQHLRDTWTYVLEHHPQIIRSLKGLDADVIITWNYQKPSFMLPAFPDRKTIAWFHGAIYDLDLYVDDKPVFPYYNDLQKKAWSTAEKIITISKSSLCSLEKVFPEYMIKAGIIYNGSQPEAIIKKASLPLTHDLSLYDFPFLICIGRLDENKNFSLVIKSIAILNKRGVRCGLLILGDGEERIRLELLAEKEGIKDKVLFLGYQQNPMPYLARALILCISSLAEGFPTVAVEAMTLGKPFVTTPVSGASEELADGGSCGLVADWNVDDYAEKINMLLTNENMYNAMSKNCVKRVQDFSIQQSVKKFDEEIGLVTSSMSESSIYTFLHYSEAKRLFFKHYIFSPASSILNLKKAFFRLCGAKSPINLLKFTYRFFQCILYLILVPLRILSALKLIKKL